MDIGVDIVENKRLENNSLNFIKMILTDKELEIYNFKKGSKKLEFLCGRFAAKEAIIKCISNYENPHMKEIEITNNEIGKPIVKYKNYNIKVSISHEKDYTIAEALYIKIKELQ